MQAFWRARKAKRDYKALVDVEAPSVATVKKFLSLLEQSDLDFSEEIGKCARHKTLGCHFKMFQLMHFLLCMAVECQRMKARVVQEIRANQEMEREVDAMDIKIGLLVKNRIDLEVRACVRVCVRVVLLC